MNGRLSPLKRYEIAASKSENWSPPTATGSRVTWKLPEGVVLCSTGLVLPQGLDEEQWLAVGRIIDRGQSAIQWALGDWWAFGRHAYGKRKAIAAAKSLQYEFGSLMNLGWVARNIEPSLRNEGLSFTHHVAVASLAPEAQRKWLARAAKMNWSVKKLQQMIYDREQRDRDEAEREQSEEQVAARWAEGLIEMAQQARPRKLPVDMTQVEFLDDRMVRRLAEAITTVADAWKGIADDLNGQYRQRPRVVRQAAE